LENGSGGKKINNQWRYNISRLIFFPGVPLNKSILKTILTISRAYWLVLTGILVVGIAQSFVGMYALVFFQRLIDDFPAAKQFGDLYAPLAGYIGLTVLNHLLIYTEGIPTSILNQGVVQWVKLRALEKIERIDYQAYIRASLISRRNRPFSTGRCART